jgi:hypothetical protein
VDREVTTYTGGIITEVELDYRFREVTILGGGKAIEPGHIERLCCLRVRAGYTLG